MALELTIQGWEKGMNKDLNSESIQGQYFDCQNFRIFVDKESNQSGLSNFKGTKFLFDLTELDPNIGQTIIGACNIRDLIVLFTTNDTSSAGGQGWIITFAIDKVTHALKEPLTLKYTHVGLGFSTKKPIKAIGHYETDNKQFCYFSDYDEETRCVNIATIQLTDPLESIGMFINTTLPQPKIVDIIEGGSLPVGIYEITAYFNTADGKKSLYCPNSHQIHIVFEKDAENIAKDYGGNNSLTSLGETQYTSKSIRVEIDLSTLPTNLFESVTLISIFKSSPTQVPIITQVETLNLGSQSKAIFTYTNNEVESFAIPYEEYLINSHPFFTNKTFSIVKNQLTVSNVKTAPYDIEWDTRTVRWRAKAPGLKPRNNFDETGDIYNNPYNDETGKRFGLETTGTFTTWSTNDQYLFQSDSQTPGGESLDGSIKYKFVVENLIGDQSQNYKGWAVYNSGINSYTISGNTITNPYFPMYASPFLRVLRQYKRGEVYRFGLIGVKDGQASFVKIIGDIKFPEISTPANEIITGSLPNAQNTFVTASLQGQNTYLHPLGIEFDITIPTGVDIDYLQIVRVPRTDEYKTRLCQGVINKFYNLQNSGGSTLGEWISMSDINDIENYYAGGSGALPTPQSIGGGNTLQWYNGQVKHSDKRILNFYTPEASFQYKIPENKDNDYLKVVGLLRDTTKNNQGDNDSPVSNWFSGEGWGGSILSNVGGSYFPYNGNTNQRRLLYTKARGVEKITKYTEDFHREKIKATKFTAGFYGSDTLGITFDGLRLRNYSFEHSNLAGNNLPNGQGAYGGTCLLLRIDAPGLDPFENNPPVYKGTSTITPWLSYRYKAFLLDYIRYVNDQYGGIAENVFENNEFIPVSDPIYTSGTYKVFNGDTFITMFNFMKNYWDNNNGGATNNDSFFESVVFPVETSVNTDLNTGKTFLQDTGGFNFTGTPENYRAQESGNVNGSMFGHNPVFSEWLMARPYFSKPLTFKENFTYDVRTFLSLNKILGENLNSWCRFPINSYLDVDSTLGPINETHYYLNQLFYLQDHGIGYISVNPRAVVGTSDGIPTKIGSAEGLDTYNYVTNTSGSIHQRSSIVVDNILYYYDGINRKFMALGGTKKEDLSEVLGMDSWFRNLNGSLLYTKAEGGDNPIEGKGVHIAYDNENKEIYITVMGNYTVKVLTYPESIFNNELIPVGTIISFNGLTMLVHTAFRCTEFDFNRTSNSSLFLSFLFTKANIITDFSDYNYTLVYSTRYQNFRGFYPHIPICYFTDQNFILSPNQSEVHLHNYGSLATFYGVKYPSSVEFISNDKAASNKVLEWMEYSCTAKDSLGNYIQNEGLDTIKISNDYQDTGTVNLTGRQKNRFRRWGIKVPRDINSSSALARIRGDWFKTKLTYNNTSGNNFNLERIGIVFTTQLN